MYKLLFADDHALFCQGVKRLLQDSDQLEIVSECATGIKALSEIRRLKPDIILLDISLSDINGITVVSTLRNEGINTAVIMLTMHDEPEWRRRAFQAGANGYLLKSDLIYEVIHAIFAVLEGNAYISSQFSKQPLTNCYDFPLSPRELEVLRLISLGLTNRQIAEELSISIKTIDTHRTRLIRKLNLHTTAELTRHAVKLGLV